MGVAWFLQFGHIRPTSAHIWPLCPPAFPSHLIAPTLARPPPVFCPATISLPPIPFPRFDPSTPPHPDVTSTSPAEQSAAARTCCGRA